MSLHYRTPKTNLFRDTADRVRKEGTFTPRAEIDWTMARKAQPFNHVLPATRRWSESLPEAAKPIQLMKAYPRIANRIALAWPNPEAARNVMDELLIDRRGGRRGFPPIVLSELLRLRTIVDGAHSFVLRT